MRHHRYPARTTPGDPIAMKSHLPLLALVPCLLLAACSKPADDTAATPATPAPATPAQPAATTPAEGTATTPSATAETRAKSNLVPDVDYVVIPNGQPLQPLDGKVAEVVEVFAYWCGHCAAFEPSIEAWKSRLPADTRFTAVPLSGGANDTLARVYFAAETTGMLDKVHGTMFNAIHNERALPPNAGNDEILAYLGKKGVDTKTLGDAMNSFAMTARLAQALQFAQRSGIEGTPTLVVNGKYRVLGKTHDEQLQIVNGLIAQERANAGR